MPAPVVSAAPARVRRPARRVHFNCQELRPVSSESSLPESIGLVPPGDGKKVVVSKVGVILTFDRQEFLQAARCLKLHKAVAYVERETGHAQDSPIMDAFQSTYVAAALLDIGRADVRRRDEQTSRDSIIRDPWSEVGCNGRCRSFGKLYRLSEQEPSFFLRVTDVTRNDWE